MVSGLAVLGVIFVSEHLTSTYLMGGTLARTRALQERSIQSLEVVSRIASDLDQERSLIDEHIYEHVPALMAAIERQRDAVVADLGRAAEAYQALIDFPDEAELWRSAQVLIHRYHDVAAATLALSRKNLDEPAHERMRDVRHDYDELAHTLFALIEVNHRGAIESTRLIGDMLRSTDHAIWGLRAIGLIGLFLLGWWMVRRVAEYERSLSEYARALEARNDDLDAFAGRVAHDLKNALAAVALAPALLRRVKGDPERVVQIADRTERSSQRAESVLDSLLAFSRAARGVEADESSEVSAALHGVLDQLAPLAERLAATVEVEDVPGDLWVRCNAGLLGVVLSNVCGNAVKYVEGRTERRVRISARREETSCRIDVADTGPGIRQDAREKIFEPFYRVEGTRAQGTGIGLATVRRIVNARGGRVAVESREGQGSRFQIWLPLASAPAAGWAKGGGAQSRPQPQPQPDDTRPRVPR